MWFSVYVLIMVDLVNNPHTSFIDNLVNNCVNDVITLVL